MATPFTVQDLIQTIADNMHADPTDPRICAVADPWNYSALEEFAVEETEHIRNRREAADEYLRLTRTGPIKGVDLLLAAQWANGRTLI